MAKKDALSYVPPEADDWGPNHQDPFEHTWTAGKTLCVRLKDRKIGNVTTFNSDGLKIPIEADVDYYVVEAFDEEGRRILVPLSELPEGFHPEDLKHEVIEELSAFQPPNGQEHNILRIVQEGTRRLHTSVTNRWEQLGGEPTYRPTTSKLRPKHTLR